MKMNVLLPLVSKEKSKASAEASTEGDETMRDEMARLFDVEVDLKLC